MLYILGEVFSNIRHSGLISLLSALIITLTITIASALILIANHLHGEVENLKGRPTITAFLKDTLDASQGRQLRSQVEKIKQITSVIYVSKAEALARSEKAFGEFGRIIIQGLEESNPLSASLEIDVDEAFLNRPMLEQLVLYVKSFPGVEDVAYTQFNSEFIRKAEKMTLGLSLLMGGASILIICFSIMLTAYLRREAIRVMRLMGASTWYIRMPLICQGTFLGGMGSLSGVGCFYGLFRQFTPQLGDLEFLSSNQCLLIVLGGMLLGLLGSLLPLRKYVNI